MRRSCGLRFVGVRAGGKKAYECSCGHRAELERDDQPLCAHDPDALVAPIGAEPGPADAAPAPLLDVSHAPEPPQEPAEPEPQPVRPQPASNVQLLRPDGGPVAPNEVLLAALGECQHYERVAVVALDERNGLIAGWSDVTPEELLGLARFLSIEADHELLDTHNPEDG